MSTDFLRRINELQRQFNDCCHQADEARLANEGRPCVEEGELRAKAAAAARELMQITDGAVQRKYTGAYKEQKRLAQEIVEELGALTAAGKDMAGDLPGEGKRTAGQRETAAVKEGAPDPSGWYREKPAHGFDDVSGMQDVKDRLWGIVERMKHKALMEYLKINRLNGFLFYGPPGCGKTFLTEAFVHELMDDDYRYLSLDAKDIHNKYSGESEKTVGAVFEEAQKAAPSLIFFDEMDAVCTDRQQPDIPQHTKSLTDAFLTAYNHLKSSDAQVFLIAATNYPQNVDPAMISRMELIRIPLPDEAARTWYFDHAFRDGNLLMAPDLTAAHMAGQTENYSYRDLERLLGFIKGQILSQLSHLSDEEGIRELREGKHPVARKDFEEALRTVLPSYDARYMKALEKWEEEKGIRQAAPAGKEQGGAPSAPAGGGQGSAPTPAAGSGQGSTPSAPAGGGQGRGRTSLAGNGQGYWPICTPEARERMLAASDTSRIQEIAAGTGLSSSYEAGNGQNNHPYTDTMFAYLFSELAYRENVPHRTENIQRALEAKRDFESGRLHGSCGDTLNPDFSRAVEEEAGRYKGETRFEGFRGAAFIPSYDGFNTGRQGSARPDFQGTCGIVGSSNIVNQQTGRRLTEQEALDVFIRNGWCECGSSDPGNNGGTNIDDRTKYLGLFGITCENHTRPGIWRGRESLKMFELGRIRDALLAGRSVLASINAYDLCQEEIVEERRKRNLFGKLVPTHGGNYKNHVVTIAGCSMDPDGNMTGLWVNDTGGATFLSNRVYITAEKWYQMIEQTLGSTISYCTWGGADENR